MYACARYAEVGLEAHPEKIHDFTMERDLLGYRLERNVLRAQNARYDHLRAWVNDLERRGWAFLREIERVVGKLTHIFWIQRFALSTFAAVYAFAQKCGNRRGRLWPSVLRELRIPLDLVPTWFPWYAPIFRDRPPRCSFRQTRAAMVQGWCTHATIGIVSSAANACGCEPSHATLKTHGKLSGRGQQGLKRRLTPPLCT